MPGFSRRSFLKLSAALAAGGAAVASPQGEASAIGYTAPAEGPVTTAKGYCPFCQVRCTYEARLCNGKILSITGDKSNYWTGGAMCPKGMSMLELLKSPYRITEPMLKQADGSWKRISYEEAIDTVVARMKECLQKNGKDAGNRVAMTMPLWDCLESEVAALMTLRTGLKSLFTTSTDLRLRITTREIITLIACERVVPRAAPAGPIRNTPINR